jgi:hypothetical protein
MLDQRLLGINMQTEKGKKLLVSAVSCKDQVSSQQVYLFSRTPLMLLKTTQTLLKRRKKKYFLCL